MYSPRPRPRHNRCRGQETNELELERMLESKSLESLQQLQTILTTGSNEEPIELSDFFALRNRMTSINENDNIIEELVTKVMDGKRETTVQPSFIIQVTPVPNNNGHYQDDDFKQDTQQHQASADDEEYDPDTDRDQFLAIQTSEDNDDVSNPLSPSQVRPDNATNNLNKDAPEWFEGIGQLKPVGIDTHLPTITEDENPASETTTNLPHTSSTSSVSSMVSSKSQSMQNLSPITQASSRTNSPPVSVNAHQTYTRCVNMENLLLTASRGSVPVQQLSSITNTPTIPQMAQLSIPQQPITPLPFIPMPVLIPSHVPSGPNPLLLPPANYLIKSTNYTSPPPQLQSILASNTPSPRPSNPLPSTNLVSQPQLLTTYLSPSPQPQSVLIPNTPSPRPSNFLSPANIIFPSQPQTPSYTPGPTQSQFLNITNAIPSANKSSLNMCTPTLQSQFQPQFQHISTLQNINSVSPVRAANPVNSLNCVTSVQPVTPQQLPINNHLTVQKQTRQPLMNQVNSNNNNTYLKPATMEHKNDDQDESSCRRNMQYIKASTRPAPSQWSQPQSRKFEAKFNNHAKGNFYISKDMIRRMAYEADEEFDTNDKNDEKLAFGYFKESVAMSINDKQIDNIFQAPDGQLVIVINIDLTFNGTQKNMYLIAMENDTDFVKKVRWRIVNFMSAEQINTNLGISNNNLPQSSRNMPWFKNGMKTVPRNFSRFEVQRILRNTRFRGLPAKTSKRNPASNYYQYSSKSEITERDLAYYVEESLLNDNYPIIPVVVIKGKNQWIEWKRIICLFNGMGYKHHIAVSLRFYDANKQWKIECMDYDAGRVYYQHRLASLSKHDEYNYSYQQISNCITTTLSICQYYQNYQR